MKNKIEHELFTIADYAMEHGGKLTVIGSFDTIFTQAFPSVHPSMYLALKFRVDNRDAGVHDLRIVGKDPNGRPVVEIKGTSDVKPSPHADYSSSVMVFPFFNIQLEVAGRYTFEVYFDEDFVTGLSLHVVQVPVQIGKAA